MAAVDPLARLLRSSDAGEQSSLLIRATITAWDATTGANTVAVNGATYTNLPYVPRASTLVVGGALLITTSGGPVILGNFYIP